MEINLLDGWVSQHLLESLFVIQRYWRGVDLPINKLHISHIVWALYSKPAVD